MRGKCAVCKNEDLEVFEVETVNDDIINCCQSCWDDPTKWGINKEEDVVVEKKSRPAVRLNTRVSAEVNDWLDRKSEEMAVSKSALVAFAVEQYRERVETVNVYPKLLDQLKEMGINVENPRQ